MTNPLERLPQLRELIASNQRYHETLLAAVHTLVECAALHCYSRSGPGSPSINPPDLMADIAKFVEALATNRVAGLGLSIEAEQAIKDMDLALAEELRRGDGEVQNEEE